MAGAEERLRARLAQDLRDAMRARDGLRIAALRTLIAALDNAPAVPIADGASARPGAPVEVPRRVLADEDVRAVLRREIAERSDAVFAFEMHGGVEEAIALRAEIELYERYAAELGSVSVSCGHTDPRRERGGLMAADLDPTVEQILAEYDARSAAERARHEAGWDADERRDQLLLRIGPDTGRLVNILIKGAGARNIVEIGTSYGYSTVWLAEAARATGGRVMTLDLAKYKQDYARGMLERAGLADFIDWRCGDALELLKGVGEPIDFVLIDLWKELYIPCFEIVAPKLARGALIVADNMLYPEYSRPDAAAYGKRVRAYPGMQSVMLEVGSGIEVSRYTRARSRV